MRAAARPHPPGGADFLIPGELVRTAGLAAVAVLAGALALALGAASAGAQEDAGAPVGAIHTDAGAPLATMTCEPATGPGRVRCEVEARVPPGESITWGDVVLQRVPPFAGALRGRVGPHDASVREPGLWRWPFALVAREKGAGEVEGRVRMVVCAGKDCNATAVTVVGQVEVGR
jgi:hypothetical protein